MSSEATNEFVKMLMADLKATKDELAQAKADIEILKQEKMQLANSKQQMVANCGQYTEQALSALKAASCEQELSPQMREKLGKVADFILAYKQAVGFR
jgi:uncharacterized Zn finger protein